MKILLIISILLNSVLIYQNLVVKYQISKVEKKIEKISINIESTGQIVDLILCQQNGGYFNAYENKYDPCLCPINNTNK